MAACGGLSPVEHVLEAAIPDRLHENPVDPACGGLGSLRMGLQVSHHRSIAVALVACSLRKLAANCRGGIRPQLLCGRLPLLRYSAIVRQLTAGRSRTCAKQSCRFIFSR